MSQIRRLSRLQAQPLPQGQHGAFVPGGEALQLAGLQLAPAFVAAVQFDEVALQCGPLVIDPGGEIGIKSGSGPAARRTVLGIAESGELAVISTTAVSLRTLAEALHSHPAAFGVERLERALNLDGGPSTAMTALFTRPPLRIEALTPVRTALLFFPRRKKIGGYKTATEAHKSQGSR